MLGRTGNPHLVASFTGETGAGGGVHMPAFPKLQAVTPERLAFPICKLGGENDITQGCGRAQVK